jgi:cell division septal protein FtsQ
MKKWPPEIEVIVEHRSIIGAWQMLPCSASARSEQGNLYISTPSVVNKSIA